MSGLSHAARAVARVVGLLANVLRRVLRVVAFLLVVLLALVLPIPIFGRPVRYEHAGRQNEPTEVEKQR